MRASKHAFVSERERERESVRERENIYICIYIYIYIYIYRERGCLCMSMLNIFVTVFQLYFAMMYWYGCLPVKSETATLKSRAVDNLLFSAT